MVYIPTDWVKHQNNTYNIFDLFQNEQDEKVIKDKLKAMDEPHILEHFEKGDIITDL